MGFFDRLKEPVFLKENSNAEQELAQLKELRSVATGDASEEIDLRIRLVEAGIRGENTIRFELANSHIPMYVLHDRKSSLLRKNRCYYCDNPDQHNHTLNKIVNRRRHISAGNNVYRSENRHNDYTNGIIHVERHFEKAAETIIQRCSIRNQENKYNCRSGKLEATT